MLVLLYRFMEHIDGERGMHLVSYRWATMIKLWLLKRLDEMACLHERCVAKPNLSIESWGFSLRNAAKMKRIFTLSIIILFFLNATASFVYTLPEGESVENGEATFERPNDLTLNVTASDKANPLRDGNAKPRVLKVQPVTERRQK